jgi:hypothetical protein
MSKAIEKHFEAVTAEKLRDWKYNGAFTAFASANGFELGILGNGRYAVKENGKVVCSSPTPEYAVEKYIEYITEKHNNK